MKLLRVLGAASANPAWTRGARIFCGIGKNGCAGEVTCANGATSAVLDSSLWPNPTNVNNAPQRTTTAPAAVGKFDSGRVIFIANEPAVLPPLFLPLRMAVSTSLRRKH